MIEPRVLRTNEVARRVGVSPETIRAWERRGLIDPVLRTPGGQRRYSESDVQRLTESFTQPKK